MSDFTSVYDAIVTRVSALLTTHNRLPDPYQIEENNEQFLKKGWGLAVGPAQNGELEIGPKLTYQRFFTITVTREAIAREFDTVTKASLDKNLMEDIVTLTKDFTSDSTLNGATNHVFYVGDTGVQRVFGDKDQFLMCQIELRSTIIENL